MRNKVPTQEHFRSSETGRFVTERVANARPATTERELIKHPPRATDPKKSK